MQYHCTLVKKIKGSAYSWDVVGLFVSFLLSKATASTTAASYGKWKAWHKEYWEEMVVALVN